jgi:dTDP-glucose 4,6-dehydratase
MRRRFPKILVTGGAGFIGSAFVRARPRDAALVVVDKLTYAGDSRRLAQAKGNFKFYQADICAQKAIGRIFKRERPDIIAHFAAETHVDRSILKGEPFINTNVLGTLNLLEASRKYGVGRFLHISTDEVYGDITKGKFSEASPLKPNSPYAASKAAADLLINSYIRTYKFPALIVRPSNNYGPWQYPEKLIPLAIMKVLRREKVPLYARGENIREWLYVDDCARGIWEVLTKGKIGEIYNLGSGQERRNIEVVGMILDILGAPKKMIEFVPDRPGHDLRYALDSHKMSRDIGWQPRIDFSEGIKMTVAWCIKNKSWLLSKYSDIAKLYHKEK